MVTRPETNISHPEKQGSRWTKSDVHSNVE